MFSKTLIAINYFDDENFDYNDFEVNELLHH